MKKSSSILLASAMSSILAIGAVIGISKSNVKTYETKANVHSVTLDSNTVIDGLSSTASSGSFQTKTSGGADLGWEFNQAKSNPSGLMILSRTYLGNNEGDEGFIRNTSPITTLESVNVVFTGSYLSFYGSIDGTTYEKVCTLSASGIITDLSRYFYFKACSCSQDLSDVAITSLSISYSCDLADYTPEIADLLSNNPNISDDSAAGYAATIVTDDVYDVAKSTHSLLWSNNLSSVYKYVWIKFDRTYTAAELSNYNFVYYVKVSTGTTLKNAHNTVITDAFHTNDWNTKTNGTTRYVWFDATNHLDEWRKTEFDLGTLNLSSDSNMIRICVNDIITAGAIHFDGFHLVEKSSYPTHSYDWTESANEINDHTNNGLTAGSSSVSISPTFKARSANSDRSFEVTATATYKFARFNYLLDTDLKGTTVTFDYLKTTDVVDFQFAFKSSLSGSDKYYYVNIVKSRTGVSISTIQGDDGRTWTHVVVDCDATIGNSATVKDSSDYQGFRINTLTTVYIDNLSAVFPA